MAAEGLAEAAPKDSSSAASAGARATAAELVRFITEAFKRVGLPAVDAVKVAELMTEADLTGADAHGVFRLPQYVRRIQAGGVNPKPNIDVRQTGRHPMLRMLPSVIGAISVPSDR